MRKKSNERTPSLRETCIKEISVSGRATDPTAHTRAVSAQNIHTFGSISDEFRSGAIQKLVEACVRASSSPNKLLLVVGSNTEHAIAQWLLEEIRDIKRELSEEILLTTMIIQAYRDVHDCGRLGQILTNHALPGDIVIFFPKCSENDELCASAIAASNRSAQSFTLGAADVVLPLEHYTDATVPVGRSQLSSTQSQSRLFFLLSLIAAALQEESQVDRPKGFFNAQAHTYFPEDKMNE